MLNSLSANFRERFLAVLGFGGKGTIFSTLTLGLNGMTPPIVVDENGDVSFYRSVEAAARALEPFDVENNEYVAYDSRGFILKLGSAGPHVVIVGHSSPVPASDALTKILRSFWDRAAVAPAPMTRSVEQLVEKCVERFGYAP